MLIRPKFRPHLRVEVVPGEGVFLLSDGRHVLLRGRLYELLAPCLDGRTTTDEVCEHLGDRASPAEVYFALNQLERKEYLCDGDGGLPPGQAALWSSQAIVPTTAASRLAGSVVQVRGLGVAVAPLPELLRSLSVRVGEEGVGSFDVVLTDSYLRDELADLNASALRSGRPWLLARPTGRQVWVGPLFRPGVTGCWRCLAERLRANAPVPAYLRERNGHTITPISDLAHTPATEQVAFGLVANAAATWIVRQALPELDGRIQTLDLATWKLQEHSLTRLPFCEACGGGAVREYEPPRLGSALKTFTNDGGHRVVRPEETLARYAHHVSPLTGAVPVLERAAGGEGVLHVYVAGNNMARPHKELAHLRGDLRNMSAGKGTTDAQAKASGLCEGLERYSGVFRGDEPRRLARAGELGAAAVPLNDCLLFSDRQYHERHERNAVGSRFSFIPEPFDPAAEIEWSPVWSLTRSQVRYLPTAFCYYDYPEPPERTFCIACSNGCAAGNTLEEAILQGFLELVERDGVALWWYNRVQRPAADLASFEEPYLDRLAAFLRERGRAFWALDLTTDLGIPVFATVCRRTAAPREQIVLGFGAHLDARIALLRAVTEMNQMLSSPLLEAGAKTDPHADPETARWLATATIANQPYLVPADAPRTTPASYPRTWTDDVLGDVEECRARVEREGLEVLVLDQTRPEIGLPVAKVIVPGLRHFWTRFAPGRLYTVPVRLGWLEHPRTEDELNPIPMFL
jgi:ribosomal protein S12 methylthiotransferase accessory factor